MKQEFSSLSYPKNYSIDESFFKKRSDLLSLMAITTHIILIFTPVFISAAIGISWVLIPCWIMFGLGMNSILNLLHESAHFLVFKKKTGSIIIGKYIIAPLIFADFDGYRDRHLDHHKYLGNIGETKNTYLVNIQGPKIFKLFLSCIFFTEAISKFFLQTKTTKTNKANKKSKAWIPYTLLFQFLFFSSLLITHQIFNDDENFLNGIFSVLPSYFFVYLFGLMGLTVFMATLRAIAEHQIYDQTSQSQGFASLRNLKCNPFSRFLMGAYGFGEHYTHHKIPGIPYYKLKNATINLVKRDPSFNPQKGYFKVLLEIMLSSPIKPQ